jgi:4-hydroxy-3-methylbut-2-enyl diphosphate reductase
MKVLLANPRGFCAGVDRAIDIVERAIALFGAPIYVRHEVVHNRFVVDRLRGLGAVFVDEIDAVPDGATLIFSAHGVPSAVEIEAARRKLSVFDATCPLVTKVHMEVGRYAQDGLDVILIGHAGHPEVEGTMGRFDSSFGGRIHLVETVADAKFLAVRDAAKIALVTQTTLSVDDTARIVAALRTRFPALVSPRKEDICYATQNRQNAVKQLVARCDVLVVVGSQSSSNSNRLREIATTHGIPGYLVDGADDLKREWFEGEHAVGVTAGASAPETLVQQVVARLREWGGQEGIEVIGREEKIVFGLPQSLRGVTKTQAIQCDHQQRFVESLPAES